MGRPSVALRRRSRDRQGRRAGAARPMSPTRPQPSTIAEALAVNEPAEERPIAPLVDRLAALGDAGLHSARQDGRAIGPAALGGVAVRGVTADSRRVTPGALFVALPGEHVDGHDYVAAAAAAGATV